MAAEAKSLKVFVSYSRTDVEFADQLVLALEDHGFDPILDRHDISGAENWRERLGKLILSADAVAFVLTPKSAASEICAWEVGEAKRLGKRIIPVTPAAVGGVAPPSALGELNWIPFYAEPAIPGSGFYYGVKRLVEALSVDLDWLRDQTRYSERAAEWSRAKADDLLLRGEALKDAQAWLTRAPANSSPPDSVREYLAASADAEQRREAAAKAQLEEREQAVKTAEAAVAEKQAAVAEKAKADKRLRVFAVSALGAGIALVAVAAVGLWFAAKNFAESAERDATLFAQEANRLAEQGDYTDALMVALSGDPAAGKGPVERFFRPEGYADTRGALVRAYAASPLLMRVDTGDAVSEIAAFPGGQRFVTFHESGQARVWQIGRKEPLRVLTLPEERRITDAYVHPDGHSALVFAPFESYMQADGVRPETEESRAMIINLDSGEMLQEFGSDFGEITAAALDETGSKVLIASRGGIELWEIGKETPSQVWEEGILAGSAIAFDPGGRGFVMPGAGEIWAWRFDRAEPERVLLDEDVLVFSLEFESGSDRVLVGGENGRIYGFEFGSGMDRAVSREAFSLDEERNGVTKAISARGSALVIVLSEQGEVRAWSGSFRSWFAPFGASRRAAAIAALQQDDIAILGSDIGEVTVWALGGWGHKQLQPPKGQSVPLLARNGSLAIVGVSNGADQVWRRDTNTYSEFGEAVAASPDGRYLARVIRGQPDVILNASNGAVSHTVAQPGMFAGFLPNGRITVFANNVFSAWEVGAGAPIWTQPSTDFAAASMIGSGDGGRYLLWNHEAMQIWKPGATAPEQVIVRDAPARDAVFHPDGERYAVVREGGVVELWRAGKTQPLEVIDAHPLEVRAIGFSSDGALMATADQDTIKLWRTGEKQHLQLLDNIGYSPSIAFSPDDKQLLVATNQGIFEWDISPVILAGADEQVKMACKRLGELGVAGYTDEQVLRIPVVRNVPRNPCPAP